MQNLEHCFWKSSQQSVANELLGYDVSLPEQLEEALSSGRMLDFCPKVVESVIEILEEIL